MDAATFLKSLLDLSPLSLSEVARRSSLNKGGLSVFARGRGYLGDSALERVFDVLGVSNGGLDPSRVHYWVIGADVNALRDVCKILFPSGGEIAGLWREGSEGVDLRRTADPGLWALCQGSARVVLKRKIFSGSMPHAGLVGPETLPNFRWRGGRAGASLMVSIPSDDFDRWAKGDVAVDEFDRLLGSNIVATWEDVRRAAGERKLTPSDVLKMISRAKKGTTGRLK